jgi:replicative DNA helicase
LQRTNKVDNNWNRQLLLDPYVLGLWLGDGCTNKTEFISEDIEVISYLTNFAENNGMVARLKNISGNNAINIRLANLSNTSSSNTYVSKNILKEALRYYGILSNKDIPDDYIYTTRENRL